MKQEALKIIIDKYLNNTPLTEQEERQLREWEETFESKEGLLETLNEDERELVRRRMWNNIANRTAAPVVSINKHRAWQKLAGIAAAIVVVLGLSWWLVFKPQDNRSIPTIVQQETKHKDIMPGGDKAILTLADGTTLQLDSARNGMLAQQGNATILKLDNGQIAYNLGTEQKGVSQYNTITTPIGGQFKVILPDGSKVMLNASSSLRYPTQFTGAERTVTLTGEGYFEIVHNDAQPFIVSVGNIEVHDLGTEFNINAYSDEPALQTTLVSGLADIKTSNGTFRLEPGKAAKVKDAATLVDQADVAGIVAWKNGLFQFDNAGIETIMRQLSRWYDVEIVYEKPITKRQITGKAFRNSTLSEMLQILELSGIQFRVEGRKIIVTG